MRGTFFTDEVSAALEKAVEGRRVFVIADENTAAIARSVGLTPGAVIPAGEENKTLGTCRGVWRAMERACVTRSWVVVNIGGGVVTDLGGFCAATFKRGLPFINVPTTLLAAVDASAGGKTGVNFEGLKNEIGVFAQPECVIISNDFFATLPEREIRSGLAEMIKHALIDSAEEWLELAESIGEIDPASSDFLPLLRQSVEVKERIVAEDPEEKGLRRVLNAGHTVGHALEEYLLEKGRPVPHGYAVAWGLVAETALAVLTLGFPTDEFNRLCSLVRNLYGPWPGDCSDRDRLIELMRHDKKNPSADTISFTLFKAPGAPLCGQTADLATLGAALDITRDRLS